MASTGRSPRPRSTAAVPRTSSSFSPAANAPRSSIFDGMMRGLNEAGAALTGNSPAPRPVSTPAAPATAGTPSTGRRNQHRGAATAGEEAGGGEHPVVAAFHQLGSRLGGNAPRTPSPAAASSSAAHEAGTATGTARRGSLLKDLQRTADRTRYAARAAFQRIDVLGLADALERAGGAGAAAGAEGEGSPRARRGKGKGRGGRSKNSGAGNGASVAEGEASAQRRRRGNPLLLLEIERESARRNSLSLNSGSGGVATGSGAGSGAEVGPGSPTAAAASLDTLCLTPSSSSSGVQSGGRRHSSASDGNAAAHRRNTYINFVEGGEDADGPGYGHGDERGGGGRGGVGALVGDGDTLDYLEEITAMDAGHCAYTASESMHALAVVPSPDGRTGSSLSAGVGGVGDGRVSAGCDSGRGSGVFAAPIVPTPPGSAFSGDSGSPVKHFSGPFAGARGSGSGGSSLLGVGFAPVTSGNSPAPDMYKDCDDDAFSV